MADDRPTNPPAELQLVSPTPKPRKTRRSAVLDPTTGLPIRLARFAAEYVANGGNGTQAALATGHHATYGSAGTMAGHYLKQSEVRQAVLDTLVEAKITPTHLASKLYAKLDDPDSKVGLDSLKFAYQLYGAMPTETRVSLRAKMTVGQESADDRLARWSLAHGRQPGPAERTAILSGQPVPVDGERED